MSAKSNVPLNVLLVEDSEDDAALVLRELSRAGYMPTAHRVDTAEGMTAALTEGDWDVVLCDYNLPQFSAIAAFRLLKETGLDLPFLIVSGTIRDESGVAFMRAGAQDYVMKGNLARLTPAIERELRDVVQRRSFRKQEIDNQQTRAAFDRYLHPKLARSFSEDPSLLHLGGEKREMTVMFADLRDFTAAAETMPPDAVAEMLNTYLDAMTEVIFDHDGLVDKFMGDGIMALWGTPLLDVDDAAALACRTALGMVSRFRSMQSTWQALGFRVSRIGVGINTGEMVIGNIGSQHHFDYTAVGDHVNLGARLETLNKLYGTQVLVSEYTKAQVEGLFRFRELDLVRVKGKQRPVRVFEVLEDGDLDFPCYAFDAALEHYRGQRWNEALAAFTELTEAFPQDGPTRVYVDRCRALLNTPPSSSWDGVFSLPIGGA